MKMHREKSNAHGEVKEANLRKATYGMIPTMISLKMQSGDRKQISISQGLGGKR